MRAALTLGVTYRGVSYVLFLSPDISASLVICSLFIPQCERDETINMNPGYLEEFGCFRRSVLAPTRDPLAVSCVFILKCLHQTSVFHKDKCATSGLFFFFGMERPHWSSVVRTVTKVVEGQEQKSDVKKIIRLHLNKRPFKKWILRFYTDVLRFKIVYKQHCHTLCIASAPKWTKHHM